MEKHLVTITMRTRVEPVVNDVVKACELAQNMRAKLWLLDGKGGRRCLQGSQVAQLNPGLYMEAAKAGLLYVELEEAAYPSRAPKWFFCSAKDANGLPVDAEPYELAHAKRSKEGVASAPAQG